MSEQRRLVVEADGGSRGNPGPAAYGALVRDAGTGEVLAERADVLGVATNNVAEYRGLIAGLQAAREIDPAAAVEARLDSRLVVEQMSGRWKIKHPDLKPLALRASRVLPPRQVTYTWVPRTQNAHADRLLNAALDGDLPSPDAVVPRAPLPEPTAPPNRLVGWAPELGVPTTLLVLRHGQTSLTAARRFSGSDVEGPPLDDVGRAQATRAAADLADRGVVAVVASPMLRTRQTAEVVAGHLGVDVDVDDGWREVAFGAWEGLTFAEVGERYPVELAAWLGTAGAAPPGGEPLARMARRVEEARDRALAKYPGQAIAIVTHSMPIRALVRLSLDAPERAMFRLQPAPASITEVNIFADGTTSLVGFSRVP
ncbi:MAG: bifunctional RNase H/acid phosphatase [Jiangellaceae bacterium]